jgi:cyclic pyranopterin phosphate synthase
MPAEGTPASSRDEILTFEEIARIVRVFRCLGVETVRLTGGEPLVRKDVARLVAMVRDTGVSDIAMTTNATALEHVATDLVTAGLRRVNVSVDSLDPEVFARITRGGDLVRVLRGIDAILAAGIGELEINTVVVRGENDRDLPALVEWAWSIGATPRFIELMPLGEGAKLGRDAVVPTAEVRAALDGILAPADLEHRTDRGPAGYAPSRRDPRLRVGFIGAVTDNFCHRCNRVRVTARGEIRACLASPAGLPLMDLIRSDAGDDRIAAAVEDALYGKGDGHEFYAPGAAAHHRVHMSRIGG